MIRKLILLGVFVTPFLVLKGYDFREPKELFSVGIMLVIALIGLHKGLRQFENKWLLTFIGWSFIAMLFVPQIKGLYLSGSNVNGLWNYKPMLYCIIFIVALSAITQSITNRFIIELSNVVSLVAGLMSILVIAQYFNIEPFFKNPSGSSEATQKLLSVTQYKVCGTFGHPTIVSSFLVICAPIVAFSRKYWILALISCAVMASGSDVAKVAMVMSVLFYVCFGNIKKSVIAIAAVILLGMIAFIKFPNLIQDSGRFTVWAQVWQDMTTPFMAKDGLTYFFTGFGFGSFSYLFPGIHNSEWMHPHNEYLFVFYGLGAIGLAILLKAIWDVFKTAWGMTEARFFATALFASCLCAGGTFQWHLGSHALYTVVIVAIIYKLKRIKLCL